MHHVAPGRRLPSNSTVHYEARHGPLGQSDAGRAAIRRALVSALPGFAHGRQHAAVSGPAGKLEDLAGWLAAVVRRLDAIGA